jgi:hypothetical protein
MRPVLQHQSQSLYAIALCVHDVVRFGAQCLNILRRRVIEVIIDGVQLGSFHPEGYVEAVVIGPEHLLGLIANGVGIAVPRPLFTPEQRPRGLDGWRCRSRLASAAAPRVEPPR